MRHFSSFHELAGNFIAVIGGCGKTTLVRELARSLAPHVDAAIAVGIDDLAPTSSTFTSLGNGIVERIADLQRKREDELLFVIDTAGDRKVLASDQFRKLVADTRHLTVILSLPTFTLLPPSLRPFVQCVFQLAEPQIAVRKTLYTGFGSFTADFDDFSRILDAGTSRSFEALVIWHKPQAKLMDEVFYWYGVRDLDRAAAARLAGAALFEADDEGDDSDCRVVDIPAPSSQRTAPASSEEETTTPATPGEEPVVDWLRRHFESYDGDVLVDFTGETGKFVRDKVGSWFTPFETIYALSRADGRAGSESEVGRELTKAGVHEWVVNLRNDEGKRRTTRVRVGLRRRRDETS